MHTFSVKPQVCFGEHALSMLSSLSARQAFLVTDPFLAQNHMVDMVVEHLPEGCKAHIHTDVAPDPSQELIDRGIESLIAVAPDLVIAFGGGSAIDAAKAMIYLASDRHHQSRPCFIAIPTTAGTGSEVTNFSVVTRGSEKVVLIDDALLPNYALLDARFTKSVPPAVTVDTGIDVLTHAIEAYVSTDANLYTDTLALRAVQLVFEHLPIVAEDGLRMRSREAMLQASCMAGMAFTNAGLGINHSLAHIIGGRFHVAHGRLNGILLGHVLRFHMQRSNTAPQKLAELGRALGVDGADGFIAAYDRLAVKLGIPTHLSGLNRIDRSAYLGMVGDMAQVALHDRCTPTTPETVTAQDLTNLLRDVL